MNRLRQKYDLKPLVIHSNYLINLAGMNAPFLKKRTWTLQERADDSR